MHGGYAQLLPLEPRYSFLLHSLSFVDTSQDAFMSSFRQRVFETKRIESDLLLGLLQHPSQPWSSSSLFWLFLLS